MCLSPWLIWWARLLDAPVACHLRWMLLSTNSRITPSITGLPISWSWLHRMLNTFPIYRSSPWLLLSLFIGHSPISSPNQTWLPLFYLSSHISWWQNISDISTLAIFNYSCSHSLYCFRQMELYLTEVIPFLYPNCNWRCSTAISSYALWNAKSVSAFSSIY